MTDEPLASPPKLCNSPIPHDPHLWHVEVSRTPMGWQDWRTYYCDGSPSTLLGVPDAE